MLSFEAETHTYTLNGVVLPSVTTIIKGMGLIDDTHYTEAARIRGQYVHEAVHLYCKDDLDEEALDDTLRPYLEGYKRFLADTGCEVEASEERVVSETYRYAGTLDLRGNLAGKPAIIDIKTGAIQPWTALQLAGYALCFDHPHARYGLQLTADGTYHLTPFAARNDRAIWLSAVALYHWKHNNLRGGK